MKWAIGILLTLCVFAGCCNTSTPETKSNKTDLKIQQLEERIDQLEHRMDKVDRADPYLPLK